MAKWIFVFIISLVIISCNREKRISQRPKNIILMIGDGMGIAQVYAAYTANKGNLNMQRCPYTGFSKTYSASDYITDSAAGGMALSSGKKTKNSYLGMDSFGNRFRSILEYAEDNEKSTGLVSTSSIVHATPASFIAHQPDRELYENIALDFLKTDIDVFIGGGQKYFTNRIDDKNLGDSLKRRGYQLLFTMDEISRVSSGKLAGLTAMDHNLEYSKGRKDMLPNATQTAINILSHNKKGFFLMVEGSMIDFGCHAHDAQYMIDETLDFDRAVGKALDFASKEGNTLVIITADHETGGICLQGGSLRTGSVDVKFASPMINAKNEHTAVMVPVFAFGPGAENFTGMFENTAVFDKMMKLFGFVK